MRNILYTRLIRPKSKNIISRNSKIENKLNSILENKLTVVKGGAAVGKSMLISSFVNDKNYMWLSLDENSNNLSLFWNYVLHGLKSYIKNMNIYIDIINPLVNREDIFDLIASLINELINEKEIIIVIDDFHYIEDRFLLETIEYFITNSSNNIHFILISRLNIPIYLGNILMEGGIVEISGEDFYLSREETEKLIKCSNQVINNELIDKIYLNTEGWIGAIKLLLTVLHNNKNIENIPKENKLFVEYINNEIISSLSKEEIDFLVKTSILSYVSPSIYNENGNRIIEDLIEKNMLIIIIDEEKKVYRYHNILKQYLISLFEKYPVDEKNNTINKFTSFLISNGNYDEAISIFIKFKKYEDALKIIEHNGHNIISTKVFNDFPMEYYGKSVDLTYMSLFFNYLNFDFERCNLIINSINSNVSDNILMCTKVIKIIIDNSTIDDYNFELPSKINNNLNTLTKTIYYLLSSWILKALGEYTKSLEMIDYMNESSKCLNNSYIDLSCKHNRVTLLEDMGRLNESENGYKEINKCINSRNYKSCFTIFRSLGLPGIYIKKCMDKEAEHLLIEAEKILKDFSGRDAYSSLEKNINYNLAEVKYIQGDIKSCEELVNYIVGETKGSIFYMEGLALKIILLFSENKIRDKEYNEFLSIYENQYKASPFTGKVGITYGIILYHFGRYEESLKVFNKIIFTCRKNGIGYYLVYSLLWKLIILDQLNISSSRECINILRESVFYSKDEDILFPYYNNRKYLKEIIKKYESHLLEDRDNKEFLKKLNVLISYKNDSEVLSSREIEVLKALTEGLSNKEISEKLYISISTVKTHIINIYSKLQVKNRVEAVNKGRKIL